MLPLRSSGPDSQHKKRKSSALDASMWSDQNSGSPLNSGNVRSSAGLLGSPPASAAAAFSTAVSRNRAVLFIGALVMFMVVSLSTTTLYAHSGSDARNYPQFKPTAASSPVTAPENPFIDPAATPRKKNLRSEPEPELARPDSFGLVIVADLDKKSRDETSSKPLYFSFLQHATLKITKNDVLQKDEYSVKWGEKRKFTTTMNEAGRGFELSELTWFDGKLLSFDDRTGIVYRLKDFEGGKPIRAIPEHIVMEGDGIAGKGQKHEWATVKDDELYMGSVGKEYTDNEGNVLADSNLWVAVMDKHGEVHHEDWTSNFARVRTALGADWPGYVVHEAIEWSPVHRQWFILPRRVSTEAYNDMLDEKRGSNKLVVASEDFSTIEVREVGKVTPLRGFSSFKFLPRTGDNIIVAIKSVEIEVEKLQTSFITVFDIKGNTLLEETELPGGHKYEGIALLHDWSQDQLH
uniref:Soluble calcium-activated nucleotidase 1 n=1 Tax=Globisporangium ultimum (strain ATCC 200006 / CBS 805.95 / DAOM BR144) TaxID=431595 RepID=K3X7H6_GLOUD